jgi:hypothetical protein
MPFRYNPFTAKLDYTNSDTNWSRTGNASTVAGTNFLGTTDAIDLVLKRNNVEWIRLASAGVSINGTNRNSSFTVNGNTDIAYTGAVVTNSYGICINNAQTNASSSPFNKYGLCITATGNWTSTTSSFAYGLYLGAVTGSNCTQIVDIGFSPVQNRTIAVDRATSGACSFGLTIAAGGPCVGLADTSGGNLNLKSGIATGSGTSSVNITTYSGGSGSADATAVASASFGVNTTFNAGMNTAGNAATGWQFNGASYTGLAVGESSDVFFMLCQTKSFNCSTPSTIANFRVMRIKAPSYTNAQASLITFTKLSTVAISGPPGASTNTAATAAYALDLEAGDLSFTAGNALFQSVGNGIKIKEGTNARMGQSTLVAGTVTVSNSSATTSTRIFLTRKTAGGTVGDLTYTVTGGSFTINSASGTDTSLVNWLLVEAL